MTENLLEWLCSTARWKGRGEVVEIKQVRWENPIFPGEKNYHQLQLKISQLHKIPRNFKQEKINKTKAKNLANERNLVPVTLTV